VILSLTVTDLCNLKKSYVNVRFKNAVQCVTLPWLNLLIVFKWVLTELKWLLSRLHRMK
jgi:hypothetical protein